jgi:hypothetical protein
MSNNLTPIEVSIDNFQSLVIDRSHNQLVYQSNICENSITRPLPRYKPSLKIYFLPIYINMNYQKSKPANNPPARKSENY